MQHPHFDAQATVILYQMQPHPVVVVLHQQHLFSQADFHPGEEPVADDYIGLAGQGWGQGKLSRLVPERHTDFLFPVVAEEWGFVRASVLILLFLLIAALLASVAGNAGDPYGALIAGGVMTVFAFQGLLHVAISLRLAPITGLTLPLMSYGGSSLVSTLAGLGLAASVAMRKTTDLSVAGPDT